MAMTVGELTGFIDLEDRGFASELQSAERSLGKLQSTTSSKTASIESTVTKSFAEIEKAIADGLDPASAIADLDRLEQQLDASLAGMLAEADTFAADLEREVDAAFASLDDEAQADGKRAGDGLVDGLKDGLKDAERVARESGQDAGRKFGDGVEGSGGGGGGGGRMANIGSTLIGGLKAGAIGLALAAGAAIGAKLMEGLEAAMDAEKAKAKLFAQLGTTETESARIGRVAGDVFANAYGESMSDVTDAIKSVVQNIDGMGSASDKALKSMSERAMDTATILDEDVSAVTRAVAQILRNDLAPNARAAFDLLVKGAQEGANKSEDLLDTFNEYGTQFRELGLSGKEALGLISQGLKAGARDADTVADALKEFAIRAQDGSATSKTAFEAIGLNAGTMFQVFSKGGEPAKKALADVLERLRGIEDPVKRNAAAVGLFGTKAEDLQDSLFALDPSTAVAALGLVDGAAVKAGDTLNDTASSKLTAFKRGLEQNVTNVINDSVMPALQRWAGWFEEGQMGADLDNLKGLVGGFFDEVGADVSAWATGNQDSLAGIKATYGETFGTITGIVSEFVTSAKEFWNEWGDTIMSVSSVVVQTILATFGGFFETLKGLFKTVKGLLTGDWSETWEGIKSIGEGATRGMRTFFDSAMREILKSMGLNWDEMKSQAKQKLDDLVSNVKALPNNLKAIASQAAQWLLQAGRDLINGMINGVKEKAAELVSTARGVVQSAVDGAKNLLGISSPSKVFAEIGKWTVAGLVQGLQDNKKYAVDTVKDLVDKIKEAFKSQPDVADGLIKFVSIGNDSLSALAKKRDELVERLANAKEMAKQVAGTAQEWADITGLKAEDFTGAGDIAAELQNKASAINNFANNIKQLAKMGLNKKIIQDIIDSGVEKGATFAEMLVGSDGSEIKALNKAQAAVDKAAKKLGKASADAMYDTGKKAGDGYLKGLEASLKDLDKAMKKIVDALVRAIKKELKIKSPSQVMAEIGQQTMAGLAEGITSAAGSAVGAITGVASSLVSAASGSLAKLVPGQVAPAGAGMAGPAVTYAGAPGTGVDYKTPPGGQAPGASGGVNVSIDMSGVTVREEADIHKIGSNIGFRFLSRGNV